MLALTAALALVLALVHLLARRLAFLSAMPRSRWLSFAGGVAVAYVFLHVLPELADHQDVFAAGLDIDARRAEMWVYLTALAGLAVFYGLERAAKVSRARHRAAHGENEAEPGFFALHIASFAAYNLLIGYLLLHREDPGLRSLLWFFLAMALHFATNDVGLRQHHPARYDRVGRWVLAGAVLAGWGLGVASELPEVAIGFLFAFLAGGVVLNVLKEELPEERESRFWPFAGGAALYGAILLAG